MAGTGASLTWPYYLQTSSRKDTPHDEQMRQVMSNFFYVARLAVSAAQGSYVTATPEPGIPGSRQIVGTTSEIDITDGGPGATLVLSLDPAALTPSVGATNEIQTSDGSGHFLDSGVALTATAMVVTGPFTISDPSGANVSFDGNGNVSVNAAPGGNISFNAAYTDIATGNLTVAAIPSAPFLVTDPAGTVETGVDLIVPGNLTVGGMYPHPVSTAGFTVRSVTGNTSVVSGDWLLPITTAGVDATVTFPPAGGDNSGQLVVIPKSDAAAGNVTWAGVLGSPANLTAQYQVARFVSDGSIGWYPA